MKLLKVMLLALLVSGCANVKQFHRGNTPLPQLNTAGSVYILLPADAMYFTKVCLGSGRAIAQAISSSFSKHLAKVAISDGVEDTASGFKKAKEGNFSYLVSSKINRWEDYATEWNGKLDQIQMDMNIFDVQTEALLDSVNFEGHGTWVTYGGYRPQNIVAGEIDNYVAALFNSTK